MNNMNTTTCTIDWNDTIDWGLSPQETIWSHSSSSSNSNSIQSPSMRYSDTPYLNTPDDKVSIPHYVDVCKIGIDTPKRANSYKPRQILGEIEPISEDNQYYDNQQNYFWRQSQTVYTNEYQRLPISNDNLSFYDQLLRDENDPYQRMHFTETSQAKMEWNIELLNQINYQRYNKQFESTVGRPILKTENIQYQSSIVTSTPTVMQPDVIPMSPDFNQYSSTVGYKVCTFCKKNGERPSVYGTHAVRSKVGKKYIVTCPILRRYVCQECGATGDNSHTISYCPVRKQRGESVPSTTISLKKTKVKSNGDRRY